MVSTSEKQELMEIIDRLLAIEVDADGDPQHKQGYFRIYIGRSHRTRGNARETGIRWATGETVPTELADLIERRVNHHAERDCWAWAEAFEQGSSDKVPNGSWRCRPQVEQEESSLEDNTNGVVQMANALVATNRDLRIMAQDAYGSVLAQHEGMAKMSYQLGFDDATKQIGQLQDRSEMMKQAVSMFAPALSAVALKYMQAEGSDKADEEQCLTMVKAIGARILVLRQQGEFSDESVEQLRVMILELLPHL